MATKRVRVALDTNLLIYAELEPETSKGSLARELILRAAWNGVIANQVLGEFLRVVQRKAPNLFEGAIRQVDQYRTNFFTPLTDMAVMDRACQFAAGHQLPFWDAVICAASLQAGAEVLLTEDLQDGRILERLRLINPFGPANGAAVEALLP